MLGIAEYFWRLIPANPILVRVVETKSKRRFDLFVRCGYLGVLVAIVVFSIASGASGAGAGSLADLAKASAQLFETLSYSQLALVCFLAPIFTAGAITQEKDSQTYDILLSTPLTNGQIVLGSMLSRLFFIVALLISGIPIFSITQIFGGVAIHAIVRSFLIAAATAFITGALAMAIAVFKVGTRRTIFSFYLFIVIYMIGTVVLDQLSYFHFALASGAPSTTSWLTGLNPFLALRTIFNQKQYAPPDAGQLPPDLQGWPFGWYLSNPAYFYTSFMFFLSFVLVSPSIVLLRRLAQSHTSLRSWVLQRLRLSTGDKNRKPRSVWFNPIAWREARTKASAARATLLRYGFIGIGVLGALVLVIRYAQYSPPPYPDFIDDSYDVGTGKLTIYMPDSPTGRMSYPLSADSPKILLGPHDDERTPDSLHGRYSVKADVVKNSAGRISSWGTVHAYEIPRKLSAPEARQFLLGAAVIELAVILLIVTNAAASTVTREKEDGTLDLLLSTPITSRYYIWGKLRGLVSFVLPLIAVPVVSVIFFVVYDFFQMLGNDPQFQWIVFPEAVIVLPGMLIIVSAFAAILGMQMSLRCRTTVMAVMLSVGIVVGLCGALGWCGWQMLGSGNMDQFGIVPGAFSPFTLLTMMIDPQTFAARAFGFDSFHQNDPSVTSGARVLAFVSGWVAIGVYAAVVWSMYKSMVKNFDMTIRKQSR
ncbi:MAG TPA: ABC transporter permease subunit [Tepidisphaeraceae bacterium]|jgi:ABC-type transport system involved in multi-copper enzyme maturation permease subunit|nr:ABC transporter permease subunit [Tepidisphaeraceae bacterium]